MIWPFKKKTKAAKISANVRCEIVDVSEVSISCPGNPLPYDDGPLIICKSKNGPSFGKIVEFGNIKKPYWFQFWKKKKYIEDVKEDKRKLFEMFGGPPKIEESCKFCEQGNVISTI